MGTTTTFRPLEEWSFDELTHLERQLWSARCLHHRDHNAAEKGG